MKLGKNRSRWATCITATCIVVLLAGGLLYARQDFSQAAQVSVTPTYQATTVRSGDLAISVSGSGSLTASKQADLSFSTTGIVAQLNVQVGDTVKTGQVLARLGETEELELDLQTKQAAHETASRELDALIAGRSARLAQAVVERAAARQAYEQAQAALLTKGQGRCEVSTIQTYYYDYLYAQMRVEQWQAYLDDPNTGYGKDYILTRLRPMLSELNQANLNYQYCLSYTAQEVLTSEADFGVAAAAYQLADKNYQEILKNSGIEPFELAIAEAKVKNASHQLSQAQNALAGATLTAPFDGTVTALNGSAGQAVSGGVFLTLANMEQPLLTVRLDESDLKNISVGCAVEATFDSIPNRIFTGNILQIEPTLVTERNVEYIRSLVGLAGNLPLTGGGNPLPIGLNAAVEVTCHKAVNALIIPTSALRQAANGAVYVYVVEANGQPGKRQVEVGIKTTAFAEIRSGLSQGERVITSEVPMSGQGNAGY